MKRRSSLGVVAGIGALATVLTLVAACEGPTGPLGAPGESSSCTVTDNGDGTKTVACSDGTSVTVADATPCTVTDNLDGSKTITCADGTSVTVTDGQTGGSCQVVDNGDGTKTVTCDDGTEVTVTDGSNATLDLGIANFHGVDTLVAGQLATAGRFIATASVTGVTADVAGVVTVNFTVANVKGDPVLDVLSPSFTIAKLVAPVTGEASSHWVPYVNKTVTVSGSANGDWPNPDGTAANQGTRERNGTLVNHGDGSYTYVFATNLATAAVGGTPIGYDRSLTHRVVVIMGGASGPTATAYTDFVPAGGALPLTRDIVRTEDCQACHGWDFHGHSGDRRIVESCVACHAPASSDPYGGESLDMTVMIHKIHAGGELASIPGADGTVWDNPATLDDEMTDNGQYALWNEGSKREWWKAGFPAILDNCTKCHSGRGVDADNWKNKPSRAACGSCHDLTWFGALATVPAGMVAHSGGEQDNDTVCTSCHQNTNDPIVPPVQVPIPTAHDFMNNDPRSVAEYIPEMSIVNLPTHVASDPYGAGQYFAPGDPAPIVRIRLRDNEGANKGQYMTGWGTTFFRADDTVNAVPPGDGPESCTCGNGVLPNDTDPACDLDETCDEDKDGKFTNSTFFVYGPRALRSPVLTYKARALMRATQPGPFSFAVSSTTLSYAAALSLIVDGGQTVYDRNPTGGDVPRAGAFSVPIFQSGASGEVQTAGATTTTFVDAAQARNLSQSGEVTWRDDQYAGWWITFTDNSVPGASKSSAQIKSNVGATVTLMAANTMVSNGHIITYTMNAVSGTYSGKADTTGTLTTLTDSTARWVTDRFKGFTLTIIDGAGSASPRSALVTGNTADTLTLATSLSVATDNTSVYMLTPISTASASASTPDTASVTTDELITLFSAVPAFQARAIAYKETNYLGATLSATLSYSNDAPINVGDTQILITAGTAIEGPASGNLILDSGTVDEEIVGYTSYVNPSSGNSYFILGGTNFTGGKTAAQVAIGSSSFNVAADSGWKFPTSGTVTFEPGTANAESVAFSARTGDTITLDAATTLLHGASATSTVTVWITNGSTGATRVHAPKGAMRLFGAGVGPLAGTTLPAGVIYFSVAAGTGIQYPATGTVANGMALVIDRLLLPSGALNTGVSETVEWTRKGDVFRITSPAGGTALAHSTSPTLFFTVPNAFTLRSRNRGSFFSIQAQASTLTTIPTSLSATNLVFQGEALGAYPVHVLGSSTAGATSTTGTASTVSVSLAKQTDATKDDPLTVFGADATSEYVEVRLDPVDDLLPGTYIAKIEFADRGALTSPDVYKTPTVSRIKFNVKSGVEELPPAANCGSCHTAGEDDPAKQNVGAADDDQDGVQMAGFVLDQMRHHKLFNNTAVDLCGACHDYQAQTATGEWQGARPISRRVHAIHNGANLTYPLATVGYGNGDPIPGRNWDITLPQDVRNCDATCHPASGPNKTSGTWQTNPNRVACGACHDSDSAQAHLKSMVYDPTPAAPYNGDEVEACGNCH
ncbi:MAG: OmcA/MtrC family decaheme c-type cytochrome [Deltaproteobacteria bacterium]|nr:OmcA/MtrC family decaheme c-type cytochrome [Deltaproteobacteria bacterium]